MTIQNEVLNGWIKHWVLTHQLAQAPEITALAGDGSTRIFFRMHTPTQTYVLLYDPEWIFSKDYPAHQEYLAKCGIPVPKFETIDPSAGCLVMEDLGDELLQHRILAQPTEKMRWLREATRLLASLHGTTFPVPSHLPIASRAFDRKKYFEELLFTEQHLITQYLGLPPWSAEQRAAVEKYATELEGLGPIVFAHRDYHTRNLLVVNDQLFMIDFQDARLGPPHYDLASLLYDAYVPTTDHEKQDLTDLYLNEVSRYPRLAGEIRRASFVQDLQLVAFQRVVKAAGSFASFFTRYGKKAHLPYLLPAIDSARELQKKLPRLRMVDTAFDLEKWRQRVTILNNDF